MARNYSSVVEPKTLTANITDASATQITLNNVTGLPAKPYVLVINPDTDKEEVVLVTVDQTGVTSPTLKVQRAIENSGGVGIARNDHTVGDVVKHMIVGSDLQIVHDHVDNTSAHDATGGVVGRTKSQILTTKTINLADNTLTGTTAQFNTALSDADFATTALLEARVPVGAVNMWVTGTAPSGWLVCDGSEKSVADYPALSTVLSTTYGALTNGSGGAGTTHFRLPDLRGRVPMGVGTGRTVADNANLTARSFNSATFSRVSDAETVTLTANQSGLRQHNHTADQPEHNHATEVYSTSDKAFGGGFGQITTFARGGGEYIQNSQLVTTQSDPGITVNNQGPWDAAEAHTNTQPSTLINFIIKF
jgi:microcystin-dependent protein